MAIGAFTTAICTFRVAGAGLLSTYGGAELPACRVQITLDVRIPRSTGRCRRADAAEAGPLRGAALGFHSAFAAPGERCRARRLPVGGRKDDLVARLIGDGAAAGGAAGPFRFLDGGFGPFSVTAAAPPLAFTFSFSFLAERAR